MRYYTFARLTKLSRNVLVHEGIFAHSLKSWMRRQILFQLRDELEEEDILADGREKNNLHEDIVKYIAYYAKFSHRSARIDAGNVCPVGSTVITTTSSSLEAFEGHR